VGVDWTNSVVLTELACFLVVGVVLLFALGHLLRWQDYDWKTSALHIAALLLLAVLGVTAIRLVLALDRAAERRLLALQASQLNVQALASGSPLACLDRIASEALQLACEKALFINAEATMAALSYVAAQLSLLDRARLDPSSGALSEPLTNIRRALEADRFGFVAQVLAISFGCTAQSCERFALLQDTRRVKANLTHGSFATYVNKYTADLAAPAVGVEAAAPAASVKPSSNLYIPSAASIPPVNIMTAEPAVRREGAEATSAEATAQSRKPTPQKPEVRATGGVNSGGTRGAPLQISPGAQ
jgi:hypothetical protein